MISHSLDPSDDDGELPAAWSVACCLIATAICYGVGNLPMTVVALSITVVTVALRAHNWVTNRRRLDHTGGTWQPRLKRFHL